MFPTNQKNIPIIMIGIFCTLTLVFASATFVKAEETKKPNYNRTTTTTQTNRAETQTNRQAIAVERASSTEERLNKRIQTTTERSEAIRLKKEEIQTNRADRKAVLQASAQTRITNLSANLSNRMDAAVNRMQNVIDRLTSRINKLNELGIDTSTALDSLDKAQQEIDQAKTVLSTIDDDVANFVGSEDPRANWQKLKLTFTEIRDSIKASHQSLRATVENLKKAIAKAEIDRGVSRAVSNNEQATTTE